MWLERPDTLSPTAPWSCPWREVVVAKGPDVMFDTVDLDTTDGTVQVRLFASSSVCMPESFSCVCMPEFVNQPCVFWSSRQGAVVVAIKLMSLRSLGLLAMSSGGGSCCFEA